MRNQLKQNKSIIPNLDCFKNDENEKYEKNQESFFQSHMNRYTLKFFNRNLEKQYQQIEFKNHFAFIKKMMWIIVLVCSFATIKLLMKGEKDWKGYAYFIGWPFSTLVTYLLLKWRIDQFTPIHTFNMFVVISLMNWTFHDQQCNRIVHSDSMAPFVRGFMFAQGAYQYITGTNFPSMAIMVLYIYLSFIFSSQQETYFQNTVSIFPYAILLIYKIYYIEKQKRITFLLQVQEKNWSNIMQKVLPTSLMILRDNEREERIELHKVNNRALKEFKVNSHEQFKHLAERMFILSDSNTSTPQGSQQTQQLLHKQRLQYKDSWDNTLYAKLKKNAIILRPIFNPRSNQLAKMKQQEESLRVFRQLYQNSIEVNATAPPPQSQNTQGEMIKEMTLGDSQSIQYEKNSKQRQNQSSAISQLAQTSLLLKDSDTLIENIKVLYKEEDIQDEEEAQILSIRINYFYLNDLYIAITIKNQSYKDKLKAQERETHLLQNFIRQSINKTINSIKYPPFTNKSCKTMDQVVINQLTNQLEFIKSTYTLPSISPQKNIIKKSTFDLQNLIVSIFELLSPIAKDKQIQFLLKNEDSIGMISQDKYKLFQALMNLLYNSLIFSKGKGYVAVELSKDQNDMNIIQFKIRNELVEEENSELIYDKDEQPNFPPTFPPTIFSPISSQLTNLNVNSTSTYESGQESKFNILNKQNSQLDGILQTPINNGKQLLFRSSTNNQILTTSEVELTNTSEKQNMLDLKEKISLISNPNQQKQKTKNIQIVKFSRDQVYRDCSKGDGLKLGQMISSKIISMIGPSNMIRIECQNNEYLVSFKIYSEIGVLTSLFFRERSNKKQFSIIQIPQQNEIHQLIKLDNLKHSQK